MKLSLLDQLHFGPGVGLVEAFADTQALARHLDDLGFARHWIVEHHDVPYEICADPMLMALALARETRQIRLGVGGILLNNYSPYKIAESVKTLSLLAPGRIDIGLGQSCSGVLQDLALQPDRWHRPNHDQSSKIDELLGHLYGDLAREHPFGALNVLPGVEPPLPWIMAVSAGSGARAGALGLPLALSAFHRPHEAIATAAAYRQAFVPSNRPGLPQEPKVFLALRLFAGDTMDAALAQAMPMRYAFDQRRRLGVMPKQLLSIEQAISQAGEVWPAPPETWAMYVICKYQDLRVRLLPLAEAVGADEIMLQDGLPDAQMRRDHYSQIAAEFAKG